MLAEIYDWHRAGLALFFTRLECSFEWEEHIFTNINPSDPHSLSAGSQLIFWFSRGTRIQLDNQIPIDRPWWFGYWLWLWGGDFGGRCS